MSARNAGLPGVDLWQTELPLSVAICAWCKPGFTSKGVISHGICPRHLKLMRTGLSGQPKKKSNRGAPKQLAAPALWLPDFAVPPNRN
jgi:hypothetical protein